MGKIDEMFLNMGGDMNIYVYWAFIWLKSGNLNKTIELLNAYLELRQFATTKEYSERLVLFCGYKYKGD